MHVGGSVRDTTRSCCGKRVSLHPKTNPETIDLVRGRFTNTMHMLHAQRIFEQHSGAKNDVRSVATSIRTRHMIPLLHGSSAINKGIDEIAAPVFHSW